MFQASDNDLREWLYSLGMHFDPFQHLDAAVDPHLAEYLVGHDVFASIWGEWIAWVFAAPGGGKTAMRVYTTQACWTGQEINRPFPLPYEPPFLSWGHVAPSLDEHLIALSSSGATHLLLALAYRPRWFLRLAREAQAQLRTLLEVSLPGPLDRYLDLLEENVEEGPRALCSLLDPVYTLPYPPPVEELKDLVVALRSLPPVKNLRVRLSRDAAARWQAMQNAISQLLGFHALYILLDGLDATPETASEEAMALDVLRPLLLEAEEWARNRVYLKGFLPCGVQSSMEENFPTLFEQGRVATTIEWPPALLAELVRRRVYVASGGAFGSLDAVAEPAVRDLETYLARFVPPLPREMLVLTRHVLSSHVLRVGTEGLIALEDVADGIARYREQEASVLALLQSISEEGAKFWTISTK